MKGLIVEDDENQRITLVELFSAIFSHCETAATLTEAMTKIQSEPFDIITMDLNMGDVNWPETGETIREIKQTKPETIIIVYSGVDRPEIERMVADCGADGFIAKGDIASGSNFFEKLKDVIHTIVSRPNPNSYQQTIRLLERVVNRIAMVSPRHHRV